MKVTRNEDSAFLDLASTCRGAGSGTGYAVAVPTWLNATVPGDRSGVHSGTYGLCGGGVRGIPSRPVTPNYVPSPMRGAGYDLRLRILRFPL